MSQISSEEVKLLIDSLTKIHEQTVILQQTFAQNNKEFADQFLRIRENVHKIANDNHATQNLLEFIRKDLESANKQLDKEVRVIHNRIDSQSSNTKEQIKIVQLSIKELEVKVKAISDTSIVSTLKTNNMWTFREKVIGVVIAIFIAALLAKFGLTR